MVKLNIILRIIVVILLLSLAGLSLTYKYGPCDQCEFNVDIFMSEYSNKCLSKKGFTEEDLPGINISRGMAYLEPLNITR